MKSASPRWLIVCSSGVCLPWGPRHGSLHFACRCSRARSDRAACPTRRVADGDSCGSPATLGRSCEEEPAYTRGYADSYRHSQDDGSDRRRYDPIGHRDYRSGDQGILSIVTGRATRTGTITAPGSARDTTRVTATAQGAAGKESGLGSPRTHRLNTQKSASRGGLGSDSHGTHDSARDQE